MRMQFWKWPFAEKIGPGDMLMPASMAARCSFTESMAGGNHPLKKVRIFAAAAKLTTEGFWQALKNAPTEQHVPGAGLGPIENLSRQVLWAITKLVRSPTTIMRADVTPEVLATLAKNAASWAMTRRDASCVFGRIYSVRKNPRNDGRSVLSVQTLWPKIGPPASTLRKR